MARWLIRWEAVFGAALLVRLLYLATAGGTAFAHPLIDADYYDALGEQLAVGDGFPAGPFWQPPLYPLVLGALFKLFGHTIWAPRILQSLLGALTAALVFSVALRVTNRRPLALIAGALAALHGPLVFYDGELLPTSLAVFAGAFTLWLALSTPTLLRALATGVVIGLAALLVAPMLLLVVPLSFASGSLRRALACAAACAAVIAPATISNYARSGELIIISANGGVNFWLGNNPDVDAAMTLRPGAGWEALMAEPERDGAVTAGAQDAWFYRKAARFCAAEPRTCLGNLGHKARLLLVARELPRNEDLYTVKRDAPVLSVLAARAGSFALPYALLLPLAAAGGVVAWRGRRREELLLLGVTAALAVTPILFFVSGRYRAPMAPVLCVLAAMGLGALWQRRRAPALACALVLVAALWPVKLPLDAVDYRADMHYAAGGRLARFGRHEEAVREWAAALARRPDFFEAGFNLILAQLNLSRPREALSVCDQLLTLRPNDYEVRLLKAEALLDVGEPGAAQNAYEALLAERADDLRVLAGLVHTAITAKDPARAHAWLDRVEQLLGPYHPELAALRARAGAIEP